MAPLVRTESGLGFGASYERFLGKKGIISIYVPVYFVWKTYDIELDSIGNHAKINYTKSATDQMSYIAPGLKIYPAGCQGPVKYAVGVSCLIAKGTTTASENGGYTYNFGVTNGSKYNRSVTGFLIANDINIAITRRFVMRVELDGGLTTSNNTEGVAQEMEPLYNVSLHVGYRF